MKEINFKERKSKLNDIGREFVFSFLIKFYGDTVAEIWYR